MSDEFDKEAEREKLREKLEKDEEKRQETQRMSELLLQGATMTNEHCENCGDPLFRDGGQMFCPTCGSAQASEEPEIPTEGSDQSGEQTQPTPVQSVSPSERTNGAESTPQTEQPSRADVSQQRPGSTSGDEQPRQARRPTESTETTDATGPRAELQRAVTTTARKATEATDPRTAKEWLEASKEAAEALAALEK